MPNTYYLKQTQQYGSTRSAESQLTPKYVNIKTEGNKQRNKYTKYSSTSS